MNNTDHAKASWELLLALNPGPESTRDTRLADWAEYWGWRLLQDIVVEVDWSKNQVKQSKVASCDCSAVTNGCIKCGGLPG